MKSFVILFIFGFYSVGVFSQTFSGQVIDNKSKGPVPYANIGIVGKDVGTASDVNGMFKLELGSGKEADTVRISCVGYDSKMLLVLDLRNNLHSQIELSPKTYQLAEVIILPSKIKMYTLGNFCDSSSCYGNSFRSGQLGTEIGILMELPRKAEKAFLKNFRFYVGDFTFDKFPVRVNIYNLENGKPYQNILNEPIYIDITSDGEYIIPLEKYNITVLEDFFISLEYYRVHGDEDGKLTFCATHNRRKYNGNGFYRLTSQGNWQPEFGDNLGFSVQVICEQ